MRHVVYTVFTVKKRRVVSAWAYPRLSSQGMVLPTVGALLTQSSCSLSCLSRDMSPG